MALLNTEPDEHFENESIAAASTASTEKTMHLNDDSEARITTCCLSNFKYKKINCEVCERKFYSYLSREKLCYVCRGILETDLYKPNKLLVKKSRAIKSNYSLRGKNKKAQIIEEIVLEDTSSDDESTPLSILALKSKKRKLEGKKVTE